ncbi:MAG: PPC domain-containing DNA-binding protein [Candidatus Bipolaricaulaceae bacterium]
MIKADSGSLSVVRFQDGERLPHALAGLGVRAAALVCGVGMLRDVVLGYWDGSSYLEEPLPEPVELLSLQGNLGEQNGQVIVHAHLVVGKRGGAAVGGHLLSATVHNTAELVIHRLPNVRMVRRPEPTGLAGLYPEEAD